MLSPTIENSMKSFFDYEHQPYYRNIIQRKVKKILYYLFESVRDEVSVEDLKFKLEEFIKENINMLPLTFAEI